MSFIRALDSDQALLLLATLGLVQFDELRKTHDGGSNTTEMNCHRGTSESSAEVTVGVGVISVRFEEDAGGETPRIQVIERAAYH